MCKPMVCSRSISALVGTSSVWAYAEAYTPAIPSGRMAHLLLDIHHRLAVLLLLGRSVLAYHLCQTSRVQTGIAAGVVTVAFAALLNSY